MVQLLPVEPLRFSIPAVGPLQTDDLLKPRFTTVAERQDAFLELRKNFNGQELSYARNGRRGKRRRRTAPRPCQGCAAFAALDARQACGQRRRPNPPRSRRSLKVGREPHPWRFAKAPRPSLRSGRRPSLRRIKAPIEQSEGATPCDGTAASVRCYLSTRWSRVIVCRVGSSSTTRTGRDGHRRFAEGH